MSIDAKATKKVMKTLADGRDGFAKGAEKLTETSAPALAATFQQYSAQRSAFYNELDAMAAGYGDDLEEPGSVAAVIHRGWMSVKDAIAGSDPEGVLDAAEQGEDHAVSVFDEVLKEDLSRDLRAVLQRQRRDVLDAHDQVRNLRDAYAKS